MPNRIVRSESGSIKSLDAQDSLRNCHYDDCEGNTEAARLHMIVKHV